VHASQSSCACMCVSDHGVCAFSGCLCERDREGVRGCVCMDVCVCAYVYSSIPGNRNWQIETADWNLDVRLDI